MANPLITIGNELHGNIVTREMTDEERDAYKKLFANENKARQARDAAQTAKEAARQAVLDKLGLTADEANALLG
jgi:selenocysteine lyase/cysteine desulfurase